MLGGSVTAIPQGPQVSIDPREASLSMNRDNVVNHQVRLPASVQQDMAAALPPAVISTNTNTISFNPGIAVVSGTSGVAAYANLYLQASTNLNGPYTNVHGYPRNGQSVTNTITSTNSHLFFRLSWPNIK